VAQRCFFLTWAHRSSIPLLQLAEGDSRVPHPTNQDQLHGFRCSNLRATCLSADSACENHILLLTLLGSFFRALVVYSCQVYSVEEADNVIQSAPVLEDDVDEVLLAALP
jgi:hypothetical protein